MQSHMQDHEQYSRDLNSNQTRIKSDDLGRCRYIIYVYTLSSVQNVCLVLLAVMICAWSIHTFLRIDVLTFSYPCYCAPVAFFLSSKQRLGPEEASLFSARLLAARNACMPDRRCCGWGPSVGRFEVKEFANQAVTYFNACFSSFLQSLYILHSDFLAPARTRHSMQGCGSWIRCFSVTKDEAQSMQGQGWRPCPEWCPALPSSAATLPHWVPSSSGGVTIQVHRDHLQNLSRFLVDSSVA